MLPLIFLFIFATIFGNDEIEERGVKTTTYYVPAIVSLAVISATTQSLAINLTQDRGAGAAEAGPGDAAAGQRLRRRPGRQLAGRLGPDGGARRRDRPARLRRLAADRDDPRDPGHARRRRLRLQLPRVRADHDHPLRGRGAGGVQRARPAALLHIRHLHSRQRDTRGRPPGRRRVSDPAFLRGLLHGLGPEHGGAGIEWGDLAIVAAWGLGGLVVALRWFRWEPRR